jgi:hypothetical protein
LIASAVVKRNRGEYRCFCTYLETEENTSALVRVLGKEGSIPCNAALLRNRKVKTIATVQVNRGENQCCCKGKGGV